MAVTFNSGTDTATLSGTEADPDTLDMIVAAVANVAKASKVGGYTYFFSFAILSAASGFLQFDADTVTTFTSTRWDKNGATGGIIFRERSVVRQEGNGYNYTVTSINGLTGYKVIAYRDIEGVNPRFILAASSRYDFLTSHDSPINTPTFVITGLDVETIGNNSGAGVSASLKFYASAASSISNLRIFSRDSLGCEFQARSGIFSFLALEGAGIAMSLAASQTLTLIQPTFNFKGSASPLTFNFNTAPSFVDIQDPLFPNGAWNGNYRGVTDGFRGSANNIVNISYTSKLIFLNGSIPRQLKVRHTRNDATNIDLTADAGGIISQLLLTSTRNGSGFSTGIVAASSTYTWSIKARLYNFVVAADSDVLYSANSFAAAASLFVQVSIVPFLALSESAAAALTGIALTASGASLGTTAITIGRTVVEVWQYYRQFIANFANFESNDTWNYDGVFLDLATWNITITAALTGKIKCAGTITLGAGGSVTSATTAATTIVIIQPGTTDLRTWIFTSGTVINVSSSTAIVTVAADQLPNITVGAGVAIQAPAASISALNFAQNTRVQVARLEPYSVASTAINTATNIITIAGNRFKSAAPATFVYFQLGSGATIPTTTPQITNNTLYFVQSAGVADGLAAGQFKLSLAQSGTAIAFSTQGSGNFTLTGITELDNSLAGAGGYSVALTEPSGTLLRVSAQPWQNAAGCTAGTFYQQSIIWNSTDGNAIADTVSISANPDIIHNFLIGNSTRVFNTNVTLPSDGSTVAGISFNAQGVISLDPRSFASVAGFPTLTPQAAYLYTVFYRSTAAGIRFIGNQFSAQDSANFSLSGLKLDNIADGIRNTPNTPAMVAGGYIGTIDGSNPILPISGAIYLNADRRGVLVTTTSGSTIAPTQQDIRNAAALALTVTPVTGSIDSKLDLIPTTDNAANVTAIKTQTDRLAFTTANRVDSTAIGVPSNPLLTTDTRLNNLDATVSSRSTQSSVNAIPSNPLLTTDTRLNNLDASIASRATQSSVDAIPNNSAAIAAIKIQTDKFVFTTIGRVDSTAIGVPINPLLTTDGRLNFIDASIAANSPANVWNFTTRTLTSAGSTLTAADVWSFTTRSLTTPFPTVPSSTDNAIAIRTNLAIELARVDASIASRSSGSAIVAIDSKLDEIKTNTAGGDYVVL